MQSLSKPSACTYLWHCKFHVTLSTAKPHITKKDIFELDHGLILVDSRYSESFGPTSSCRQSHLPLAHANITTDYNYTEKLLSERRKNNDIAT